MTKTLTTERLHEIVERRSPSLRWGEAEQIAAELLANREAKPVAYLNKFSGVCMTLEQQPNAADDAAVYVPLYTAPPAPVVNPEFTGATAVPDFKKLARELVENLVDCGGVDDSSIKQYLKWTEKTCRAAMLAAPEGGNEK